MTRRVHAGALALVLLGGFGALAVKRLDAARPVTVDQALERFRGGQQPSATPTPSVPTPSVSASAAARGGPSAAPGTPGAAGPRPSATPGAPGRTAAATPTAAPAGPNVTVPPEGVYVYATTGFETGDAGPMHARHDYPAETTMIVTRDGCGSGWRWEPVENRWDDISDCAEGDTTKIRVYDTVHEFFGVKERHTYTCSGASWFRPPSRQPGYRWEFDCVAAKARTHTAARVVGVERVSAGDGMVDALHVAFDTTMTGSTVGTNPTEYWIALDGPYLVRKTGRVDATVHTEFGSLDYHEEYDVRLTSRRPRT